jgi:predicted O-methyltransferase YrrM
MKRLDEFFVWLDQGFDSIAEQAETRYRNLAESTAGWASPGKMLILNTAIQMMDPDEEYLEIGSYVGRSLIGALEGHDRRAQVIDPYDLFLPDGIHIFEQWDRNTREFGVQDRVTLHKQFSEQFSKSLPPIGVAYFDGDHDSGFTYETLKNMEHYLSDQCLIICDDYLIDIGTPRSYPGHPVNAPHPVKVDVDNWVAECPHAEFVCQLPWENVSAVIRYERN